MKTSALLAILLAALFLSACGEKPAEAPTVSPAPAAAPAAPAPAAALGGYTPTADELVPGITRTKEEQDKINVEGMAGTPMPAIPGEAPTAAPVEAAPVEAAPVEAAPEAAK